MIRNKLAVICLLCAASSLSACHDGPEVENPDAARTGDDNAGASDENQAQDIIGAIETRADMATLVSAIEAAGLSQRLTDEPLTLFAPTDDAFDELPQSRLEQLVALSDRADLRALLNEHVVAENLDRAAIERAIEEGDGSADFATIGGDTLTIARRGDELVVTSASGSKATLETADIMASNGVVHIVDQVLLPAEKDEPSTEN